MNFVGARWNGSNWSNVSVGLRNTSNTRIDDLSVFGDLALGRAYSVVVEPSSSGDWNNPATWGGAVPGVTDTVRINNAITITLNANAEVAKLVVNAGGIFDNSTNTLTVNNNLVLDGTWTGSGGKISMTTANDTIRGSGSMTGTCTLEIAGNKVIGSTANITLTNVSILTGTTLSNNGIATISSLTGADATSTFVNNSGSTLVFTGANLNTITLNASACPNTVAYSSTSSQTLKPTTYCSLNLLLAGQKTLSGSATANGNIFIDTDATMWIQNTGTLYFTNELDNTGVLISDGQINP
jgi:hypothetical protein